MSTLAPSPDLEAIKQRQRATWGTGDYAMVGTQIVIVSERLVESLDLRSTERVLDVATGSGNAALAAARRGCDVVGVDYVPSLLDRARTRGGAEQLAEHLTWIEGDAEALPVEDASFDVVTSVFGAMFAPNHHRTADELLRACRPGGRIGLVSHTPGGFIGRLFKVNGKHVPPPAGVMPPVLWGTEDHLRTLFDDRAAEIRSRKRNVVFRYRSPQAYVAYWRRWYGPTIKAFEALDDAGKTALEQDILGLIGELNRADDGTMVVPSEYLEAVITKR